MQIHVDEIMNDVTTVRTTYLTTRDVLNRTKDMAHHQNFTMYKGKLMKYIGCWKTPECSKLLQALYSALQFDCW